MLNRTIQNYLLITIFSFSALFLWGSILADEPKTGDQQPIYTSATQIYVLSETDFIPSLYPRMDIEGVCKKKWTKKGLIDWRMVRYCINSQEDAEAEASSMDVSNSMRQICINRWSNNWRMYRYCLEQQKEAHDSLLPSL